MGGIKKFTIFPGESIDILVDRTKTLLRIIAGKEPPMEIVSLFILDALPRHVAEQVRLHHGEKLDLESVISCVKSLLASATGREAFVPTVTPTNFGRRESYRTIRYPSNLRCFTCNERGHIQRNCPTLRDASYKRPSSENDNTKNHPGNGSAGVASQAFVAPEKQC